MKLIEPSYEILTKIKRTDILKDIELAGRVCYKSEEKITEDSASKFVSGIVKRGHLSVIEHKSLSVRFICNRGFTHELVRHRLATYSQESTRYCNYGKSDEIKFIRPSGFMDWSSNARSIWVDAMIDAEGSYLEMIEDGSKPQDARGVLPIDVKTEIVITANLREWLHIFSMRCPIAAHPSMRQLMHPLRDELAIELPEIFVVPVA